MYFLWATQEVHRSVFLDHETVLGEWMSRQENLIPQSFIEAWWQMFCRLGGLQGYPGHPLYSWQLREKKQMEGTGRRILEAKPMHMILTIHWLELNHVITPHHKGGWEEREKGREVVWKLVAENSPNLRKYMNLQIQEVQWTSSRTTQTDSHWDTF